MEFKGTRQDWGVCSARKTEVNSFNGVAIAECGMSQMATQEEKEANARLIAAAPEMLKALQKAAPLLKRSGYEITSDICDFAIEKALCENV